MLRSRLLAFGSTPLRELLPVEPRAEYPVYTCPAGYRAIVRDVRLGFAPGQEEGIVVSITVSGPAPSGSVYLLSGRTEGLTLGWTCDVVLEPGMRLFVDTEVPWFSWLLSGAELVLPTQW